MKIEMDETSGYTTVFCTAIVVLLLGSLGGCYMVEQTNQAAIKAGLTQQPNMVYGNGWYKASGKQPKE